MLGEPREQGAQHPPVDGRHQVVALRRGNEGTGRQDIARLVAQPDQDLHEARFVCLLVQGKDGLGIEQEALFLEGIGDALHPLHFPQLTHQFQVVGLEYVNAVAPLVLGRIAGGIGRAEYLGKILALAVDGHHADAHADAEGLAMPGEVEILDVFPELVGNAQCLFQRAIFQQHGEFVASQPGQGVVVPHPFLEQDGQMPEHFIPRHMAAGVVDDLELVQIQVEQGMLLRRLLGGFHGPGYPVFEFRAVEQAGNRDSDDYHQ